MERSAKIQCNCTTCIDDPDNAWYYQEDKLYKFQEVTDVVQCQNSGEMVLIQSLLKDITEEVGQAEIDEKENEEIPKVVEVFISYSHKDEGFKDELRTTLKPLERWAMISIWDDRNIEAGGYWKDIILDKLEASDIIILLISPDFMASDFCIEIELENAIERHLRGKARVLPLVIRICPQWRDHEALARLQTVLKDGKSVTEQDDRDKAWGDVYTAVKQWVDSRDNWEAIAEEEERRRKANKKRKAKKKKENARRGKRKANNDQKKKKNK
ncbi:MAG: toll/interleukin-1 receptor domain-containing protein [Bacteroidota bacterium]